MKKLILALIVITGVVATACSKKEIIGIDLVEKAREDCETLNSATVIIKNEKENSTEQNFSFLYNDEGVMTYLYTANIGGTAYIEYNDGEQMCIFKNGEITILNADDENFIKYSRENPHKKAGRSMVIFNNDFVEKSSIVEINDKKIITHEYDAKEMQKKDLDMGEIEAFSIIYHFDKDDNLLYYTESIDVKEDGETHNQVYSVKIKEKDQIAEIEMPDVFVE